MNKTAMSKKQGRAMQTIEEKLEICYQNLDNALHLKDWSFLSSYQQQVRQVIHEALQKHDGTLSEEVIEWLDKLQALYQTMENACKTENIHVREQMSASRERMEVIDNFLDSTKEK